MGGRCVVVWRPESERWFVTMPAEGTELAPVFDTWMAAAEIAGKFSDGHAFCSEIPTMPLGTEYPRPGRMQPSERIDLLRFMPFGRAGRRRAREELAREAGNWGLSPLSD